MSSRRLIRAFACSDIVASRASHATRLRGLGADAAAICGTLHARTFQASSLTRASDPAGRAGDAATARSSATSHTPSDDPVVPPRVPLMLDGRQHESRTTHWIPMRNPATQKVVAHVPVSTAAEVNAAVQSGIEAFPKWAARPLSGRTYVMFRFHEAIRDNLDELVGLITQEQGKTIADARHDVLRGLEVVEQACAAGPELLGTNLANVAPGVDCQSMRLPLGVCACVCPQLFPAMLPLWTMPLAIVAGNSVVLKPSEGAPSAAVMLSELALQSGVPNGVLNAVHGGESTVDLLVTHPDVKAVSFVGSSRVGHKVYRMASMHGKRVQASMSAKNHAVVMPDADMDFAAHAIARASFGAAGQRSMAVAVVVLVGNARASFVPKLLEQARRLRVNAGHEPRVDIAPVATVAAKEKAEALVLNAINMGATVDLDGRGVVVPGYEEGNFIGPTVLSDVTPRMDVYKQEIFGPVLVQMEANDLEDAIRIINENEYGNGCSIFTSSPFAARRFKTAVEVGMVGVNIATPTPIPLFSFTGMRGSFAGDLHMYGREGLLFYTQVKTITSRWPLPEEDAAQLGKDIPDQDVVVWDHGSSWSGRGMF